MNNHGFSGTLDTVKTSNPIQSSRLHQSTISVTNRLFFTKIIQAQLTGLATLPYGLGLEPVVYRELINAIHLDPLARLDNAWTHVENYRFHQRSDIIKNLMDMRLAERNLLVDLLFHNSNDLAPFSVQAAIVVATACLNPGHLWKSLGFQSRAELCDWLTYNFPDLVASNTKNMRWKRFFYLQLCQEDGDFVCRSPSCETCSDYCECYTEEG